MRCACRRPGSYRSLWAVGAVLLVLAGCAKQNLRLQADDDAEPARYSVETINQWAAFDGADPMAVFGVGLVTGLANTGGEAAPGDDRTMLEKELQKQGVVNAREALSRKDTALVHVSALIPPGSRKGDPVDIEVTLPPGSKATSLEGGYLEQTTLYNFASIGAIAPNLSHGSSMSAIGHPWVVAQGKLLVGMSDGDETARVKQGACGAEARRGRPGRSTCS